MDNNMKLLAKIASRFNLIALIFLWGMLPDLPRRSVLYTLLVYPKVIIFSTAIAFSGPPLIFCPCYAHEKCCYSQLKLPILTSFHLVIYHVFLNNSFVNKLTYY